MNNLRFNRAVRRPAVRFYVKARRLVRPGPDFSPIRLWVFSAIIAAATAYAVIGFRWTINSVSMVAFGADEKTFASGVAAVDFARVWAAPVIGGLVISVILYFADRFEWLKDGRGQGVADVIEARAATDGRISLRAGIAAATVSAISLGVGGSADREGPAVHLGATLASFLDRHFGFSLKDRRTLLGCGAAAAVAASFNAPIAGVLFALEVVMGSFALSVFGPIAAASVTAAVVTRINLGNFPAFLAPAYGPVHPIDALLSTALGLFCGLVASAFLASLQTMTDKVRSYADRIKIPYMFLPPFGGAIIGLIGALYPEVLGVCYEAVSRTLAGDYAITISLMVAVALATLVTQSLVGKSFFHWQLSRRGYDLSEGPQGVLLQTIRVRDVMKAMPEGAPIDADAPRLFAHTSLGEALARLEALDETGLPVVDEQTPEAIIGYLSRIRALAAYNRALVESHIDYHR